MSDTINLTITGMTCNSCAGKVQGALESTPGVASAQVSHVDGSARVAPDGSVPVDALEFALDDAVTRLGYTVEA
ncbi:cation transporter [Demequina sp.]|uniref:cation transporter n=1 Tax=Demequina sp. TaxID=2050685 RepID=UPI003A870FEE